MRPGTGRGSNQTVTGNYKHGGRPNSDRRAHAQSDKSELTDGPLNLAHDLVVGNRFPAFVVADNLWLLVDFLGEEGNKKKKRPRREGLVQSDHS